MPRSLRSLDAPSQQMRHFTNRHTELHALQRILELKQGSTLPVLMFWGVGGTGKSWLLRRLREALPQELPFALLDLDPASGGTAYHTDSSRALAELRRQLGSVAFPRFDLAYAWIRYKEGVKDEPLLKGSGVLAEVYEFITSAAPIVLDGIPMLGWLAKQAARLVKKSVKNTAIEAWLAKKAGQEDFQRMRRATAQELYPELANRFLQDAADNLPPRGDMACRGIVFLDTFEALRLGVRGDAQLHDQEKWVRSLYAVDSPLLLVVAGRDRLRWDELDPDFADATYLDQHLVGGLSEGDARDFLMKCGIADLSLQNAVLRVSIDQETSPEGRQAGYHPFSLGLCADTIQGETTWSGAVNPATFDMAPGDTAQLAQRFLKSLSDPAHEVWVKRLALTPRFDEAAAREAFSPGPGAPQDAAWQAIQRYSFVHATHSRRWWTLHARMRGALSDHSATAAYHAFWIDYWQRRSASESDDFAALSWYHRYCLTPGEARDDWEALAQRLRNELRMAEHYALLSWWEPTDLMSKSLLTADRALSLIAHGVEYGQATLGDRSKNLRRAIACFGEALHVYTKADFPPQWAGTQNNLGIAYKNLPTGDRGQNLRRAIACFKAALQVDTEADSPQEWAGTQNNLGNAYSDLPTGDRGKNLRRAIACYKAALRAYTESDFPQDWAATQNNRGVAYSYLPTGDRGENLRRAIVCYEAALRHYTESDFPQDWARTLDNLGSAYQNLPTGDRNANLRRAIVCYEAALRVRTERDFPQEWAISQNNLGSAFWRLPTGDRDVNLRRAVDCFEAAERGYRRVGMQDRAESCQRQANDVRQQLDNVEPPKDE